jgi:ElaB/YqjD/DUF883 family membrane-anchored ribosome-binding protein
MSVNTQNINATAAETSESARRATSEALGQVEAAAHSLRDRVEPTVARLASQAETLARRGLDAVRDSANQVRDRATSYSDSTVRYVKDEPVKAVLIAAAAGAAIVTLLSLIQSARRNR